LDISHFSPSQREVVETGDGPLSVLAGPGSGKTTVLAGRIAYLVERRGVAPATILAITFTTAAAATLRQRLAGVLGDAAQDLTISTFHALGLRLIKQWSGELGFGDGMPAVYGRDDARALLREVASDFGLEVATDARGRNSDPWALSLSKLTFAVDRFRLGRSARGPTSDDHDEFDEELLRPLSAAYETLLLQRGAVDYPSMLTLPSRLFEDEPRALRMVQDAYRFVMADEFQDTSDMQFNLLRRVVERHRNLAVMGDPKQAIFSWLGADPSILLDFSREYPEARVYPLDQNHRSTGVLVALSNALAAPLEGGHKSWTHNPQGPLVRVFAATDELDEARFVADEINRLLSSGQIEHLGEVGVLFRTNAQARAVSLSLRAAGVPFKVRADADLFGLPEVRDVIAYLRLAHCPADGPALARVVNTPPRRLRAIEQALRKRPVPVAELPDWAHKRGGPSARRGVEEFLAFLNELHHATRECRPAQALQTVLRRTGYATWLAAQKDGAAKLARLEELESVMDDAPAPDLATWLTDMHLGQVDGPAGAQAVVLSTIHSAKGAEWPVVFAVGLEEGLLPLVRPWSVGHLSRVEEEERRLAYVAFSRAQVLLFLVYCQARRPFADGEVGRLEPRRPSRFLLSLPPDLLEHVDRTRIA
jgi:DNA helicase-2/ATP-dependent DNA helicase PcrA